MNRQLASSRMTTLPPFVRERFKPTEAEYRHALSLIPPDTRDLTARFCGDPIYERSALYKKRQEAKDAKTNAR